MPPSERGPSMRIKRKAGILVAVAALVGGLLAIPGSPAHADLFNPRQDWLRPPTGGLFLPCGGRTSPGYTDCTAWQNAVVSGGGDRHDSVQEGQKLPLC